MKFKLNDWKKVSQGAQHTVLRNNSGHELKIFHSKLSPHLQKQLTDLPAALQDAHDSPKKFAEGGAVGGSPCKNPSCKSFGSEHPNCRCHGGRMAKGGVVSSKCAGPHKKDCQYFAEGGAAGKGSPAVDEASAKAIEEGAMRSGWDPATWLKNLKEGLGVQSGAEDNGTDLKQHYAGGTDDVQDVDLAPQAGPPAPEAIEPADSPYTTPAISKFIDQPAPVQEAPVLSRLPRQGGLSALEQLAAASSPIAPEQGLSEAPRASQAPSTAPTPNFTPQPGATSPAPGADDPFGTKAQEHYLKQGIDLQFQGAGDQGRAAQAAAELEHSSRLEMQRQSQELLAHTQKEMASLSAERKGLIDDIKSSHIDPNHYFGEMSTGGKISTAIGLVLGGLGAGLAGGQNQALEFMNKQIDRDIDSQKAELGRKETLLSANYKQFGNLKEATDMTRIQMNDIMANQVADAAAKSGSLRAKGIAESMQGQIYATNAGAMGQLAMLRSMNNANGGKNISNRILAYTAMKNEPMAKYYQERYISGVTGPNGEEVIARDPVPQATRDQIVARQTFDARARDLYNWSKAHSGELRPAEASIGHTKAAELQSMYRNAINGGVFKKGEQEYIDKIIDSDPGKFFNSVRVLPKLKETIDSNRAQQNILHHSVGLPEVAEPAQYSTMGGKQYMKVPGGWKPVR